MTAPEPINAERFLAGLLGEVRSDKNGGGTGGAGAPVANQRLVTRFGAPGPRGTRGADASAPDLRPQRPQPQGRTNGMQPIEKTGLPPAPPVPPQKERLGRRPWPHRYAGHVAALAGDRAVAFVSGEVLAATAHIRTAWDWLADNDPPVGTYTEEECQERLSRARAALTAHGVPPAIPLEALDRHHCARLRAEGALIALDALAERVAVMREAPEYPTLDAAFAAALEDVRGRYTHDKT